MEIIERGETMTGSALRSLASAAAKASVGLICATLSTINFLSVPDGENRNLPFFRVDRVGDAVIVDANAVSLGSFQFAYA
jgi:hypothetical protein